MCFISFLSGEPAATDWYLLYYIQSRFVSFFKVSHSLRLYLDFTKYVILIHWTVSLDSFIGLGNFVAFDYFYLWIFYFLKYILWILEIIILRIFKIIFYCLWNILEKERFSSFSLFCCLTWLYEIKFFIYLNTLLILGGFTNKSAAWEGYINQKYLIFEKMLKKSANKKNLQKIVNEFK